jgi:hypothetical protein
MNGKIKYLVLFGVDAERKARAAKFELKDEAAVRKAAGLMNYRVGLAKSDDAMRLASALPDGKLFESGLGMAPMVREETFNKLFEVLSFDDNWISHGLITGAKTNLDAATIKAANELWCTIKVGSIVLAFDTTYGDYPMWQPAVVVSISKNGETLELRWRDWPGYKPFETQRKFVALFRPDVCA